ncbi:membrane protein [Agromyces rhizosphaerae]|uniref:Membrane protein n=1 Tax=Agromyces rhizosphaerae TaxID=88374 RepID=A0A9W6CRJ1_9MICO|nr:SHOCT domain-containing protein [Agromyces rhizosphaerae]GLI27193.1 membrane protein [Agromyces rhizosphaerae]
MNLWEFLVWLFWIYIAIACIWVFIIIVMDIFRDHGLNGWAKALWIVFLIVLPFLAALIYLIARGSGMSRRRAAEYREAQAQADAYIRSVAGSGGQSAAAEIHQAKSLLDSGTITQAEFDQLKAKALQGGA